MYSIRSQLIRDGNFAQLPLIPARGLPFSVKVMFGAMNSMVSSLSL